MNIPEPVNAKIVISGTFEFRDAAGNVVKTMELKGEVPLSDLQEKEKPDGDEHRE